MLPDAIPSKSGRIRRWWRRARRERAAIDGGLRWYRAGYIAALEDIERTGLRPNRSDSMREAADRALRRWIEND